MFHRFLAAVALIAIGLLPSRALAAGEVFTVRNIPVDATAAGSSDAREIAIANGQRVAFDRLVHRLTRRQDWSVAPQATAEQVADLVLGIEVAEERSSSTRYVGKITYSFKPAAVRQFLRQSGIPFSEARSKPALLLPVLDAPDGQHLWDDPNPWRTAWAKRDLGDELVPIIVPLNDLEDSTYVSASQAAKATWADVAPIAEKYGLDRVLVARAIERGGGIEVRLTQLSANQAQPTSLNVSGVSDVTTGLDQGVNVSLDKIYEDWKTQTIVVAGQQNTLYVSIWFSNLADWLTIQRRLKQTPTISQMEIVGLSPKGAEVRFNYGGTIEQLRITLEQLSLTLNQRDGYWELAMSERASAPQPAPAPQPGNTN